MKNFPGAIVFVVSMLLFSAAFANNHSSTWQLVPKESHITFTAIQNSAPVIGEFKSFTGESNFDPTKLTTSFVKIIIDMNSVSTSYRDIADTLKTADWFNIKAFPQAIFIANSFTKTGENTYKANGSLTIRDKTVPTVLSFTIQQNDNNKIVATGSVVIKRSDFGVGQGEWLNSDDIKNLVMVKFEITATK